MGFQKIKTSSDSEEHQDLAEINIIPLVDVMLVLLIIFMVAAPLSISGISVDLPLAASTGKPLASAKMILTVDKNGAYFMDKENIATEALEAKLKAIFAHQETKEIFIRADRKVVYDKVVYAMGAARGAGVRKISMLTTPHTLKASGGKSK